MLAGLLALISAVHYAVGGASAGILHGLLGHLYIVPIILGAYWYGAKGGVSVSIASAALFSPHLFLHWHDPFLDIYNYVELFLFLLIGGVTGVLSEMERNQRMRHDEAMRRLDESHRKLKEQTDILFQTEEQLRRADRLSALGELSAGMAHEIRNPLGAIKGAVEILKDDYSPEEAKYEFIQILLKETDRLNRIVQEFLGFARPKQPEYQQADVNESLEAVLTLTAQEARKAGVKIVKRLDPSIGKRSLDAGLLKQAFLNLVLNAIQAMPTGRFAHGRELSPRRDDRGQHHRHRDRHLGRKPEEALQSLLYDQEKRDRARTRDHLPDHRKPPRQDRCRERAGQGRDVYGEDTGVNKLMERVYASTVHSITGNTLHLRLSTQSKRWAAGSCCV